jgi:hypothetical protein
MAVVPVIPAKAGIHAECSETWIPGYHTAGMTGTARFPYRLYLIGYIFWLADHLLRRIKAINSFAKK